MPTKIKNRLADELVQLSISDANADPKNLSILQHIMTISEAKSARKSLFGRRYRGSDCSMV